MEEDLKILEDETNALGLFFKCKGMEVYKRALENLLTRYKQAVDENMKLKENRIKIEIKARNYDKMQVEMEQIVKENKIYKEELKKIDKALNLEEGTAAPYRSDIIESLKRGVEMLKEIIDNSVPKSKIKEKIEELKESIKKAKPDDLMYIEYCEDRIEVLQELLAEE